MRVQKEDCVIDGRHWCSGNIGASQALAPGSIPGWRTFATTCLLSFRSYPLYRLGWRYTFSAVWLRSSVVSVLNEVTFVTSPLDSSEAITDILWYRGGSACIHPTSWPQPCTNSWGRGTNQYIENDSMAQRQRVGFQIQRLGVRIPLGSLLHPVTSVGILCDQAHTHNDLTPWRNGSALDSKSKGWGFESLWGHFDQNGA